MQEYSKRISEIKIPNIYRVILYTGCWICGIWSFYHTFTYTRQYFEGLTTFDVIFIALMIPIGVWVAYNYREKPTYNLLLGFFGLSICGFFGLFNTPFGSIPAEAPIVSYFWGLIHTQRGAANFGFILLFSIVLVCGMFQFWYWEKIIRENTMYDEISWKLNMGIAILLSLGIYNGLVFSFSFTLHSVFYIMAFISSVYIFIIGLMPGNIEKMHFSENELLLIHRVQNKPTLEVSTKILRTTAFFLSWITASIYIIMTAFLYHQFTATNNRVMDVLQLNQSLIIGAAILLITQINLKISKFFKILIVGILPLGLWFLSNFAANENIDEFSIEAGIIIICAIWMYIERVSRFSKSKLTGAWLVLSLGIAGYFAFIPAHKDDIFNLAGELETYLVILVVIDLISIYIFSKIPDVNDIKDYVTKLPIRLQKHAKERLGKKIINKIKEEYENEP